MRPACHHCKLSSMQTNSGYYLLGYSRIHLEHNALGQVVSNIKYLFLDLSQDVCSLVAYILVLAVFRASISNGQ
jgi:hypothetical protein